MFFFQFRPRDVLQGICLLSFHILGTFNDRGIFYKAGILMKHVIHALLKIQIHLRGLATLCSTVLYFIHFCYHKLNKNLNFGPTATKT